MIAGDTNQRNFSYPVPDPPKSDWSGNLTEQSFLRQAALGFNCLNYAAAPEGSLFRHFLPDKAYLDAHCPDGVRFELMFPSCWNGVDVDSHDHKSHVEYPSEVMTGDCHAGFETRLISLFYETIWNTYQFNGVAGRFVLSNGDLTGKFSPFNSFHLTNTSRVWLSRRFHDGLGRNLPSERCQSMHQPLRANSRLCALQRVSLQLPISVER